MLLKAAMQIIKPEFNESYVDLTAGYGGHAEAFLAITKNYRDSVLVDRDAFAIENLAKFESLGAQLMHSNFLAAAEKLLQRGRQFDIAFMDIGVSSPQLDGAERGFSFNKRGPLDMRMDRRQALSAYQVVNEWSESELADIFVQFGEEKRVLARRVASEIVQHRPIDDTLQLAELISSLSARKARIHPATRIFQAIRIAVNDELSELENTLELLPKLLKPGGRVGVISFHSLEDRLVKQYFKRQLGLGLEATFEPVTKKPISGEENDNNPRARSAKLRVYRRL
ncbi:MAG: 16S rRNA (cytosine(1402)-N(4))-methyltransferase RsmH [Candidatus Nomurabacteria bacterium]|nr:16S rRNA (cytosine(1402)-N(4))-methyltransferase RsmH [Candidatus Nomurabacteria bacterium]